MEKNYQIHIEWVNQLGQTVQFSSEYMTLADVLQVKHEYPHSIVTYTNKKGQVKYAS